MRYSEIPRNVRLFEICIYLSLVPAVAAVAVEYELLNVASAVINLIWWTIIIALIWLTARRRSNIARWVLFYLFISQFLEIRGFAPDFNAYYGDYALVGVLGFTTVALEAVAYYFVFTGDSRDWFVKRGETIIV
jgi:hypothetical protein